MSVTDDALKNIRDSFAAFDSNGDMSLDLDELTDVLQQIAEPDEDPENVKQEAKDLMLKIDKDSNGKISYMEFFSAQQSKNLALTDAKAAALTKKLASFFQLQRKDQDKVVAEHKAKHEKYEQEIRMLKEEAAEREKQAQEQVEKHRLAAEEVAKEKAKLEAALQNQQNPDGNQDELAHLREENEKLRQELSQVKTDVAAKGDLEAKLNQVAQESTAFQSRAITLQTQHEESETLAKKLKAENDGLHTENDELHREKDTLAEEVRKKDLSVVDLKAQLKALEDRVANSEKLEAEHDQNKGTAVTSAIEEDLKKKQQELDEVSLRLIALNAKLASETKLKEQAEADLKTKDAEIAKLSQDSAAQLQKLEKKVHDMEADLKLKDHVVADLQQELSLLQQPNADDTEKELLGLRKQVAVLQAQSNPTLTELSELRAQLSQKSNDLAIARKRIDELEENAAGKKGDYKAYEKSERVQELSEELRKKTQELTELRAVNTTLSANNLSMKLELDETGGKTGFYKKKYDDASAEAAALKADSTSLQAEVAELRLRAAILQKERDDARTEKDAVHKTYQSQTDEFNKLRADVGQKLKFDDGEVRRLRGLVKDSERKRDEANARAEDEIGKLQRELTELKSANKPNTDKSSKEEELKTQAEHLAEQRRKERRNERVEVVLIGVVIAVVMVVVMKVLYPDPSSIHRNVAVVPS